MAKVQGTSSVNQSVKALTAVGNMLLTRKAGVVSSPEHLGNVIGTESYTGDVAYDKRVAAETDLNNEVKQFALENCDVDSQRLVDGLTFAQRRAGNIVLMAKADTAGYARVAMESAFGALDQGTVDAPEVAIGSAGSLDYGMDSIAMEYFNSEDLDKHLAASYAFNVQSARQSAMAEAFFRTIVVDPTECGMLIEIQKTMVHHAVRHALHEKDRKEFDRRNILDAQTDPKVLEDESISFVPFYIPDGENASNFVDSALFKPYEKPLGDYDVLTAPLAFNGEVKHLLSLSAHPGLVNSGYLDESDELSGRIALENLYFSFNKKGAPASDAKLVRMPTLNLARASFNKSQEGDAREMLLNFRDAKFLVGEGTKSVGLLEVPALEELIANHYSLTFTVNVSSTLNIQTGKEDAQVSKVRVLEIKDENGTVLSKEDPTVKALLENIVVEAAGYDYKATRSASNKRTKGLLIDHMVERERYKITLGSPITSRKPTGTVDDSQRLNDLIVTARIRNDNLAITKLINYSEQLDQVYAARTDDYEIPSIEGVGRHYVAPWFEKFEFDAEKMVGSLESSGAAENLANSILGVLREQVVRAYMQSRFQPAIEMLSGYTISKPHVTIGTDVETANWLWVPGDVRTLGDQFDYSIYTTNDIRFRGRIQWVFTVEAAEGGFSPLNFGNHLWVPELVTNTNLTRNDATTNELTVQPRNYHMVNVPITGIINVVGIKEYINARPGISVISSKALDGDGEVVLPTPGTKENA